MSQPYGSGTSVKFSQTSPSTATFHGVVEGNAMTVYFPSEPPGTFVQREFVWDDGTNRWESANPNFELYAPIGPGAPPNYRFAQGPNTTSAGTVVAVA